VKVNRTIFCQLNIMDKVFFLPRDATLARYMLSSCHRVSAYVRHKLRVLRKLLDESNGFWHEAFFHLSHTVLEPIVQQLTRFRLT